MNNKIILSNVEGSLHYFCEWLEEEQSEELKTNGINSRVLAFSEVIEQLKGFELWK